MENILEAYNVSRETINELKKYEALVVEWNNKFNLISKSSVQYIWERHILDSLQLCQFIKNTDKIMYDFGSGAGFPAIVLSIVGKQLFPELKIFLVESITKKALFLNTVKNELNLNIEVINDRIENIKAKNVDLISSRAMASLDRLIDYSKPFCNKNTHLIFPKGSKYKEEIDLSLKKWKFDFDVIQSKTDETGKILYIRNIRRK